MKYIVKYNQLNAKEELYAKFCEDKIGDAKIKNMAVQGITQKEDYE